MTTPPFFYAAEVTAFKPGGSTLTVAEGHGTAPHGALAELPDSIQSTATIYASDSGYRTRPTDADPTRPYPPLLSDAFQINNAINLDPGQSAVGATWGTLNLANPNSQFDAIAAQWNSDGRPVVIRRGQKVADLTRGILLDPGFSTLSVAFAGVATPWFLSDSALQIPLRDATYWVERALQVATYDGSGTYGGTADLAGKPKPKARGGTSGNPIANITATLIDPTNRIYQYSDGPGTVVNLYEGGALTYVYAGDTTNLYAGSVASGHYRTDNSRGLFQLAASPAPAHAITADVTGAFPVAGAVTTAIAIARYLLTEDLLLPAANINTASFTAMDSALPYTAGIYFDSNQAIDGVSAVSAVLAGLGAKLVSFPDGTLRVFVLRAIPPGTTPVATFNSVTLVSLAPAPLPAALNPPPYRLRVGYSHNYTVQTSDLNTATATAAQIQFIASADRFAAFSSATVLSNYNRPNDPLPIIGALLKQADALAAATDQMTLWGVRRRLYLAVVPLAIAVARNIGDVVNIVFPMDDLAAGKLGQIVGYSVNSGDSFATFQVLV